MASRLARALRRAMVPARPPTQLERISGWAFLVFTLLQVPCFLVDMTPGTLALSPLQICAAHLANAYPEAQPAVEAISLPGSWFRNAFSPWLRCLVDTRLQGPCQSELANLGSWAHVADLQRTELRHLQKMRSGQLQAHDTAILYGSAIIVVSALLALVHTVKLSIVGFLLLFAGIYQAGHNVLPPFILLLFLCGFAALRLDGSGEPAAVVARTAQQSQVAAVAARSKGKSTTSTSAKRN